MAGHQFSSDYYGWTLDIPSGWEVSELEFSDFEIPEGETEFPFQEITITGPEEEEDGFMGLNEIVIMSLPVIDGATEEEIMEEIREDFSLTMEEEGGTVKMKESEVTIDGITFQRLESFDEDDEFGFLNYIHLMTRIRDYVLHIEISYDNLIARKTMWEMIEFSKFKH